MIRSDLETAHTTGARVAVIGAGYISDYHIRGLQAAGAQVEYLYSRNEETARAKAQTFSISHYSTDLIDILERSDIEGVVIATPDHTHEEFAVAALQHKKSVLVQKPIARTLAEGQRMVEAARESGSLLCVSYMHRYFEEVDALKQLLDGGSLGDVFYVRLKNATPGVDWAPWQYKLDAAAGGVVMQLGVHGIDLLTELLGPIDSVLASTSRVTDHIRLTDGSIIESEIEDLAICQYRFRCGAIGTHEMMFNEVGGTDRFRMEIDGTRASAWLRTGPHRLTIFNVTSAENPAGETIDLPIQPLGMRQHRHFIDMMRGTAPDDRSVMAGMYGLRVAEAIYKSAATGSWVAVANA
ncbi:MAG: Gfo/Idh/MocA family oxidoreductase [Thermomicrobiales bacterium]|nr:Gfo/Idh/MocA family oxidoreductase [Thermomicrobiales bacterium]